MWSSIAPPVSSWPRWLTLLAAELLVAIVILNIYFRSRLQDKTMKTITFGKIGVDGLYEATEKLQGLPKAAEVHIVSSAGSGGYTMMVLDIFKHDENSKFDASQLAVPNMSSEDLRQRVEQSVNKYGVTAHRPVIEEVVQRPGAPQLYKGKLEVSTPGQYAVVYAMLRPWEGTGGKKIYYVVRIEAI